MGAGGIIIIRNLKSALSVGCNAKGSVKLWQALIVTHALCALAGAIVHSIV